MAVRSTDIGSGRLLGSFFIGGEEFVGHTPQLGQSFSTFETVVAFMIQLICLGDLLLGKALHLCEGEYNANSLINIPCLLELALIGIEQQSSQYGLIQLPWHAIEVMQNPLRVFGRCGGEI